MDLITLWINALISPCPRQRTGRRRGGFRRDEDGVEVVEYVLLLAMIFLVALVSIRLFGTRVSSTVHNNAAAF
jgi:Flp pilus assembly pilin Flp